MTGGFMTVLFISFITMLFLSEVSAFFSINVVKETIMD
jgi:hypothetical protein